MEGIYLLAILGYICLLWLTGVFLTRRSRSSEAYLVASRGLSIPFISVLIAGTWIGGVSIVGMAQGAYIHGISALWFQVGIWVAMFGTAIFLTKIMKDRKTYSILDVVGSLYERKTARLAGIFQLIFSIWVVTMQVVGGGAILTVILKGRVSFTNGMLITAVVFTLYNVLGGFVATAYTNLIHICAIVFGIFLGGLYVILNSDALSYMIGQSFYFKVFGDLGVTQALSWAFINFTLGILAQPVINTASSAKALSEGRKGIIIGNIIAIPVVVMAALCGIMAKRIFPNIPSISALPSLLDVVPPYIAVFFLISMWAPLMSSGSPFLMGATTLTVKGYIAPIFNINNDRRLLMISRLTTLMIGAISFGLGFFVKEILREVTWIAVLLSAIVYIVFAGWIFKGIKSVYALISLTGTILILFLCFISSLYKVIHPIWPITIFIVVVMFVGIMLRNKEVVEGH